MRALSLLAVAAAAAGGARGQTVPKAKQVAGDEAQTQQGSTIMVGGSGCCYGEDGRCYDNECKGQGDDGEDLCCDGTDCCPDDGINIGSLHYGFGALGCCAIVICLRLCYHYCCKNPNQRNEQGRGGQVVVMGDGNTYRQVGAARNSSPQRSPTNATPQRSPTALGSKLGSKGQQGTNSDLSTAFIQQAPTAPTAPTAPSAPTLQEAVQGPPPVGCVVEAHGLQSLALLNGQRGVVIEHRMGSAGQMIAVVKFDDPQFEAYGLKSANLRPPTAPPVAPAPPVAAEVVVAE